MEYDQGANSISEVSATTGYFGGMPSTWVVDVPDFSGASSTARPAGLHSGSPLSWQVVGAGGNVLPFFGATIVDGAQIIAGLVSNSSASFTCGSPTEMNRLGDRSLHLLISAVSRRCRQQVRHALVM